MLLPHSMLLLAGLLLASAVGRVGLWQARRVRGWVDRLALLLFAMLAPLVVLGMLGGAVAVMLVRGCLSFTWWDVVASVGLLGTVFGLLLLRGAQIVGRSRAARLLVAMLETPAAPELQAEVQALAQRMGRAAPRVRVLATDAMIACTAGLWAPRILLSEGLLGRLDRREREAVLAHELAHLERHDLWLGSLAAWLDAGLAYLSTVRAAVRILRADRELAADALAVARTGRPMALASALLKLQRAGGEPHFALSGAIGLGDVPDHLTARLEQLLASSPAPTAVGWWPLVAGLAAIALGIVSWLPLWWMPAGAASTCMHGLM